MKKLLTILMLSAAVCLGATAKPSAQKPIKPATSAQLKTFIALYEQGDQANLRRDINRLNEMMAPDFKSRSLSGRVTNRAQRLINVKQFFSRARILSSTSSITNLGFRGRQSFVTVLGTGEFEVRGADKKTHRVRVEARSNDTWILSNHGWLFQSTSNMSERIYIDGRKVSTR